MWIYPLMIFWTTEQTDLHIACMCNDIDNVRDLIESMDVNIRNKYLGTALHTCCCNPDPNFKLIKILVENGADVNARDNENDTPLYFIGQQRNTEIRDYLVENGADINEYYRGANECDL